MKRQLKRIFVILLVALSCGALLLFGGCTDKKEPINVEILIINPLTGKELTRRDGPIVYMELEMPEETLIQARFKNKETGEYLTAEEIEPVKTSIRFGVIGLSPDRPP